MIVNNGKDSGQEIPHVHFHIIPRVAGDYSQSWAKSIESTRDAGSDPCPPLSPHNLCTQAPNHNNIPAPAIYLIQCASVLAAL